MTTGLDLARRELTPMLDDLFASRSRLGEFDWAELVPDVADTLKRLQDDGDVIEQEIRFDVARRLVRDYVHRRSPSIPKDTSQLSLFYDSKAPLTLGERQVIVMAQAEAHHVERWRSVLTGNFQAQSTAYFGWMSYIDDRLPQLRDSGGTLDEIERALGEDLS